MAILKHTVAWGPFCRKFLGYLFALLLKGPLSQVLSKDSSFNNHFLFIDFTELRGNYLCPSYLLIKLQTVRLKEACLSKKRLWHRCFIIFLNFSEVFFRSGQLPFNALFWVIIMSKQIFSTKMETKIYEKVISCLLNEKL